MIPIFDGQKAMGLSGDFPDSMDFKQSIDIWLVDVGGDWNHGILYLPQ